MKRETWFIQSYHAGDHAYYTCPKAQEYVGEVVVDEVTDDGIAVRFLGSDDIIVVDASDLVAA